MRKKIKKYINVFLLFIFCIFIPFQCNAANRYNVKVISESDLEEIGENTFNNEITFLDADGLYKKGSYYDVFRLLKDRYGFEPMPQGTWGSYNSRGDAYDTVVFMYNLIMIDSGMLAQYRDSVQNIMEYTDEHVQIVNKVQNIIVPVMSVVLLIAWVLGLSNLAEKNKLTNKTFMVQLLYTIIAFLLLINIENVSAIFCGLSNNITEKANLFGHGMNNGTKYAYYTLQEVKDAAKAADTYTFAKSKTNAHSVLWNLEMGLLLRFLVTNGALLIMRTTMITFLLNLILLPAVIADIPLKGFKGMGGRMILTLLGFCLIPSLYYLVFTIGTVMQSAINNTYVANAFVATFAIPLCIIPLLMESKALTNIIAKLVTGKYL